LWGGGAKDLETTKALLIKAGGKLRKDMSS